MSRNNKERGMQYLVVYQESKNKLEADSPFLEERGQGIGRQLFLRLESELQDTIHDHPPQPVGTGSF